MEVTVVNLTVQQICLKVKVLAVDMPEDSDVLRLKPQAQAELRTALDGKGDGKRVAVRTRKEMVLCNEVKGCAFLQILIQG